MKIRVDVEISPEELRRFLGLPDVAPLQQEIMEMARRNLMGKEFEPTALLKSWAPWQVMETMQKNFWEAVQNSAAQAAAETEKSTAEKE